MKNKVEELSASELMDMIAFQLRTLQTTEVSDALFDKKVMLAGTIFNGAGKAIKLSAYQLMRNSRGKGQALLPEQEK